MATNYIRAVREYYLRSATLQKATRNFGWLLFDRVFRMGASVIVSVWVARYLGPSQYGTISYATAFATLFGTVALLNIDTILVRELVASPARTDALLGSAFFLKLSSAVLVLPIVTASASYLHVENRDLLYLVFLSGLGFVVQSTKVFGSYFESQVQSKVTVYAGTVALFFAACLRVALILLKAPLVAFGCAALFETLIASTLTILAYRRARPSARWFRFDRKIAHALLRDGWPLVISGFAITLYMRIDQVMLGQLLGEHEVGVYSAALRLSEVWYFVPVAVVATVFPSIVSSQKLNEDVYRRRIGHLFALMVWPAVAMALAFSVGSGWVIRLLYGESYAGAESILRIHIWTGIPVGLGVAYGAVLAAENAQVVTLWATGIAAVANVLLNWLLIPSQHGRGAALATLLSQCIVVLSTLLFKKSRRTGVAMLRALVLR